MPKAQGLATRAIAFAKSARFMRLDHAYEREIFFVAAVGASAFYVTALASFSPLDASAMSASWPETVPSNLAGTIGAALSGMSIFALGATAWLLPIPVVTTAFLVVFRRAEALARTRLMGWLLVLASIAAILSMKVPHVTWHGYDFPTGGVVGDYLASTLMRWLGGIGSLIGLATVALCASLMVWRKSLLAPVGTTMKKAWSEPFIKTPLWWDNVLHRKPSDEAQDAKNAKEATAPKDKKETKAEKAAKTGPAVDATPSAPLVAPYIPQEPEIIDEDEYEEDEEEEDGNESDETEDDEEEAVVHYPTFQPPVSVAPIRSPGSPRSTSSSVAAPYLPPPLSVFNKADTTQTTVNPKELEATATLLVRTFEDFGVHGKVIGYQPGPVVTVYEYQPDAGVKQSKVLGLIDDLALTLKVDSIFIHPVRGKRALGVQVPNSKREPVHLGDILNTPSFRDAPSPLTFGLGKTISGQPMCADLAAMPHLLVAGATGSGKSVGINAMLSSIIMKATPEEVRMILVDPKMLELSVYEGIPHLLMPVITEPTKASLALKWAASEMERRYKLMQLACVRNIAGFNEFWVKSTPERKDQLREAVGDANLSKLPYILLVIDELADLMMTAPKDVESSIQRLAQKARASGIHMVLATQRPSVDIITGVIKANLPCRMAFQVVSKHDSRTILDLIGAEKLLGKGDLLLQRPGSGRLERLQGALITDEEVINLVAAVKETSSVHYDENIIAWIDDEYARQKDGGADPAEDPIMDDDPKFTEAIALARAHGVVSASFLQRHLKIGYNRAARMVEFMQSKGLVDKADGAKPRKWLGPVA